MIQPSSNMYASERPAEFNAEPSEQWNQYMNARTNTQGVQLGRTTSLTTPDTPLSSDTTHISNKTTLADKLRGTAETLAGRVTKNQGMIERGQVRKGV